MARKRAPRPVSEIAEEASCILYLDAEPVEFEADDFEEPPVKPFYQGDRVNIRGEHTGLLSVDFSTTIAASRLNFS